MLNVGGPANLNVPSVMEMAGFILGGVAPRKLTSCVTELDNSPVARVKERDIDKVLVKAISSSLMTAKGWLSLPHL